MTDPDPTGQAQGGEVMAWPNAIALCGFFALIGWLAWLAYKVWAADREDRQKLERILR